MDIYRRLIHLDMYKPISCLTEMFWNKFCTSLADVTLLSINITVYNL